MCGKRFAHLGSHLWHRHGVLSRDYKEEFDLPFTMSLIGSEVKRKKQEHFEEHREEYVKNLLKGGKKYQFKKGDRKGEGRRVSESERKKLIERIEGVNKKKKGKLESCPVCKMTFFHLESHLFNKHRLLKIK